MTLSHFLAVIVFIAMVMFLAGMIFFRIRIGRPRSDDPMESHARRNSLVIAFVVAVFIVYWVQKFLSGKFIEEGIVGWKVYAAGIAILMGIASIILLIVGSFRKK